MGSPRVKPGLDLASDSVNTNPGRTWVSFVWAHAHFKRSIFFKYFAWASEAEESGTRFSMSKEKTDRGFTWDKEENTVIDKF